MHFTTTTILSLLLASSTTALAFNPIAKRQSTTNTTVKTSISPSSANNAPLIAALLQAATAVDRQNMITLSSDFVYDFQNPPAATAITHGDGGQTVKADRKLFPPLIGTGVSMTVGFLGPCGFNTPHVHPRSSEINIIVAGELGTEYILENGARPIFNTLGQYQMTVFPQGAVHTEFNPDCTPAVFVAGFASEDPGVQQSAQTLLGLDDELVSAVLGADGTATIDGKDIDTFRNLLPKNVALGVDQCLQKCGLTRNRKRSFMKA